MSRNSRLLLVLLGCLLFQEEVFAQFGGINAEFAGGGARALSMGGAFIGLADDSTASEFNPAGLWNLRRPELALQGIYSVDERDVLLPVSSFNAGTAVFDEDRDSYWIPSYVSYVHPFDAWTVSVSQFTNVFYDRSFTDPAEAPDGGGWTVREQSRNHAFGVSIATEIAKRISVGATARYNRFEYELDSDLGPPGEFDSDSPSANLGILWRAHRMLQFGAVYKSPQPLKGDYQGASVDTELPDTLGIGVAFLPTDRWRLLADVDYVQWSRFEPDPDESDLEKEDVWRYHTGFEWYAGTWRATSFFLRGGYRYEESNGWYYRGDSALLKSLNRAIAPVDHYTFGFGFARPDYQLDFGVDLTGDSGHDLITSLVWHF